MATVEIVNKERKGTGTVELPASIFGAEVKTHLMHHVVTAKLAAARAGTHDTKTRKDVSGEAGRSRFARRGPGAPGWERPARRCFGAVASFSDPIPGSTKGR